MAAANCFKLKVAICMTVGFLVFVTVWFDLCRELLKDDKHFHVPKVFEELSTDQVLVTEYIPGVPLDKCSDLSQETRDKLGKPYVHEIIDN